MSYNWKCCSFYPNNFDASALRSGYDDNEAFLRRLSGEKEKTKHVKRENNSCEKEKPNRLRGF